MDLYVSPRGVLKGMLLIIAMLFLANIMTIIFKFGFGHGSVFGLVNLFSFRSEENVPTLYSSLQLIASSILLFLIGLSYKVDRKRCLAWWILATVFMLIAVDEIVQIHERMVVPLRETYDLHGIFYFSWVIPGSIAVFIFALSFTGFLRRLPRKTAWRFVQCGAIYVTGAIGFEMLGGMYSELNGRENIVYAALYTTEESLEMLAIAYFVYALLDYLIDEFGAINVSLRPSQFREQRHLS